MNQMNQMAKKKLKQNGGMTRGQQT